MEKHGEFNQFVYFRLLAFTGLRRSEALALKKSDININERSLSISRTLAEDEYKSTIVSNYTKTGNAEDEEVVLYLDDYTFEVLIKLCEQTRFRRANHVYVEILDSEWLFVSPKTGRHYSRTAANDWIKRFWEKHGDELRSARLHYISPHGFRHSQATMLFELGIDSKDAQHRLRHKNIKTTMDIYTHISESRKQSAVDKLNQLNSDKATSKATLKIISMKKS